MKAWESCFYIFYSLIIYLFSRLAGGGLTPIERAEAHALRDFDIFIFFSFFFFSGICFEFGILKFCLEFFG